MSVIAVADRIEHSSEKQPWGLLQLRILFLILLLYTIDGADMQILGVTVSALSTEWGMPLSAFGAAMAAGHAGSAIGASIGGFLGDRFGRRPVIIGGTILFGLFSLVMTLATTPSQAMVLRFIAGLGMGGCLPPALALLTETLPAGKRSLAVSLAILCAPLGISISGFLAATVLPAHGWQTMFLLAGIAPFATAILFWFSLPESPTFLARRPHRRDELDRLLLRLGSPELRHAATELKSEGRVKISPSVLLRRVDFIMLLLVFFCVFGAMSMVLSWLPALLTNVGFSVQVAGTALSSWSLAGIVGVFVGGVLMSRFSTRSIVAFYIGGSIGALGLIGFALPHPGQVTQLALFYGLIAVGGFALNGSMSSIYAHAASSLPADVRATGIGVAATCGRLGGIIGALAGAHLLGLTGANGFFVMTAGVAIVALAIFMMAQWKCGAPQRL